jgi:hypothetical protein
MFLQGHPNHQLVFMRMWQIEPSYLTDAFRDFYTENPLNITRILDVAQDLKVTNNHTISAHRSNYITRSWSHCWRYGLSSLRWILPPLLHEENISTSINGWLITSQSMALSFFIPLLFFWSRKWRVRKPLACRILQWKTVQCPSVQTLSPLFCEFFETSKQVAK